MHVSRRRATARRAEIGSGGSHRVALPSGAVVVARVTALREALRRRAVPNRWSHVFGIASVGCLVILLVTGVALMFFYAPSGALTQYRGSYRPLSGVVVSKAYASTVHLSFEVRGGLLLRQLHHWAALLLPASVTVQLLVTFFTGEYRRPRRAQWVLSVAIFGLVLAGGWSGYALPDDMLAGTGMQITQGVTLAIPFVGTTAARLLFGGSYPGRIIEHLYPIHVAVVPVLLVALLVLRGRLWWIRGPAQPRGPGRTSTTIVGMRLYPVATIRAAGLLLVVTGSVTVISAIATISPLWLYGPADPTNASAGSQPDWYTGFLDGALRLVPSGWEVTWRYRTWTLAILIPLAVVTAFLALVALSPFIEEHLTADHRDHHLLDRPRDKPTRTGVGAAGIVFYCTLWFAAAADVIATVFHVSFENVILLLQVTLVVGPPLALILVRAICVELQARDRDIQVNGVETGRVIRLPNGGYVEVHRPIDAAPPAVLTERTQAPLVRATSDHPDGGQS